MLKEKEIRILRLESGTREAPLVGSLAITRIDRPHAEYRTLSYRLRVLSVGTAMHKNFAVTINVESALKQLRSEWKSFDIWIDATVTRLWSLGLANPSDAAISKFPIDYRKSVDQVFLNVGQFIIKDYGSAVFLATVEKGHRKDRLPTWTWLPSWINILYQVTINTEKYAMYYRGKDASQLWPKLSGDFENPQGLRSTA
ncbi:hypothetical protein B7494_g3489 [Chlorociboria aeruginascens]|nr:hypothetical protein B7494_g3489 [Chlorociboria aeruginascens]